MKKITTSFAVSAALISSMASADSNPFGVIELPESSYMQVAEAEMACGANMKMDAPVSAEKVAAEKAAKQEAEKAAAAKKATESATAPPKH